MLPIHWFPAQKQKHRFRPSLPACQPQCLDSCWHGGLPRPGPQRLPGLPLVLSSRE